MTNSSRRQLDHTPPGHPEGPRRSCSPKLIAIDQRNVRRSTECRRDDTARGPVDKRGRHERAAARARRERRRRRATGRDADARRAVVRGRSYSTKGPITVRFSLLSPLGNLMDFPGRAARRTLRLPTFLWVSCIAATQ